MDYAPKNTAQKGWRAIHKNIETIEDEKTKTSILEKIELIKAGKRDLYT
jgi:2-iminoacetate synthase